jgi:hypothetical protein
MERSPLLVSGEGTAPHSNVVQTLRNGDSRPHKCHAISAISAISESFGSERIGRAPSVKSDADDPQPPAPGSGRRRINGPPAIAGMARARFDMVMT